MVAGGGRAETTENKINWSCWSRRSELYHFGPPLFGGTIPFMYNHDQIFSIVKKLNIPPVNSNLFVCKSENT